MIVAIGALQLQVKNEDTLVEVQGDKEKPVGRGLVMGFGTFSGQCAEETPIITSPKPKIGLCLIFKRLGEAITDPLYVSGPITQVVAA